MIGGGAVAVRLPVTPPRSKCCCCHGPLVLTALLLQTVRGDPAVSSTVGAQEPAPVLLAHISLCNVTLRSEH